MTHVHDVFVPVFQEGDKHYHTTINKTYIPMTEKQAEIFMRGERYTGYVKEHIKNLYWFVNKDGYWQPRFDKDGNQLRETETEILMKNQEKIKRKNDKEILMSVGINGLRKKAMCMREASSGICETIIKYALCYIFCWPWVLYEGGVGPKVDEIDVCATDPSARNGEGKVFSVEYRLKKRDFGPGRHWYVPENSSYIYPDPLS
jgi:hypothetical protein